MALDPETESSNEVAFQKLRIGDVQICASTFGSSKDIPILLLAGGAGSMLFWDDEFCKKLAAGSRFVMRFDQRDTGQSTVFPIGGQPYTLRDLANDALGVLDAFGVQKAHLFGFSLGGGVSQSIAEECPERVLSLIQMSTSPIGAYKGETDLATITDEHLNKFMDLGNGVNFSKKEDVVPMLVNHLRLCSSPAHEFDEAAETVKAERNFDHTVSFQAAFMNHGPVAHNRWPRERLSKIKAPTLVIHGEDDVVIPYPHGVALKNEIPGAELLTIKGIGHELPIVCWDEVIQAVLAHTILS